MHWCLFGFKPMNWCNPPEESTWETGATLKPKLCRPISHGKMGCLHGKYRGTFPNTFRDRGAGEFLAKTMARSGETLGYTSTTNAEKKDDAIILALAGLCFGVQ